MTHRRSVRFAASSAVLAAILAAPHAVRAQEPVVSAAAPTGFAAGIGGAYGATADGDVVRAGGPSWSATFAADGVAFSPLGAATEHPVALRWRLERVRRGERATFSASGPGRVAPAVLGDRVEYRHAPGLVEAYDVRSDGIEQTFVLAQRPEGDGDLVVELALASDVPCTPLPGGGVRFALDGGAGVDFGALTGVDANGAKTPGRVHTDGRRLVLTLAASFVDHCAYPLVLDPLVGSAFTIASSGSMFGAPSAAFDNTIGRYLVVWSVALSSFVAEIRGQYVAAGGTLFGPMFTIASDAAAGTRPGIANVNSMNRFVVAWCSLAPGTPGYTGLVRMRSIDSASTTMSPPIQRGHPNAITDDVCIGGDARLTVPGANNRVLVVYHVRGSFLVENSIQLLTVDVQTGGFLSASNTAEITSTTVLVEKPSVSKHCGIVGNWLVVYGRGPSITGQADEVRARLVDDTGAICGTTAFVKSGSPGIYSPCAATQDGLRFLVAWSSDSTHDVEVRRIIWNGTCAGGSWGMGSIVDPTPPGQVETGAALDFAGSKYLLSWSSAPTVSQAVNVRAMGLDLADGTAAGAVHTLASSSQAQVNAVVAAKGSAISSVTASDEDEALLLWQQLATSTIQLRARRFEAVGTGLVAPMGGGCGTVGFGDVNTYNGTPVLGTSTFSLALAAPTSPVLGLVVGFGSTPIPCGSCTLVPALDVILPGVSPTPFAIPMDPNLIDAEFFTQWLLLRPSGCPILPDIGLSNALKFTIRE